MEAIFDFLLKVSSKILSSVGAKSLEQRILKYKENKIDYSNYSGKWYGLHISRGEDGESRISKHEYEWKVSKDGNITGELIDTVDKADTTYKFKSSGKVVNASIHMLHQSPDSSKPAFEVFWDPINPEKLLGVFSGYDRSGLPFCSFIILKRGPIKEKEYLKTLEEKIDRFFLEKNTGENLPKPVTKSNSKTKSKATKK